MVHNLVVKKEQEKKMRHVKKEEILKEEIKKSRTRRIENMKKKKKNMKKMHINSILATRNSKPITEANLEFMKIQWWLHGLLLLL